MRASQSRGSTLLEILIGTLVLSICFATLCAYASYQRNDLIRSGRIPCARSK